MTLPLPFPPDEDIVINTFENRMSRGRYYVDASYKSDPYLTKAIGSGHAQAGTFHKLFGIGDSLEASLKKETCKAVKELKQEWVSRELEIQERKRLSRLCKDHIKECQ